MRSASVATCCVHHRDMKRPLGVRLLGAPTACSSTDAGARLCRNWLISLASRWGSAIMRWVSARAKLSTSTLILVWANLLAIAALVLTRNG